MFLRVSMSVFGFQPIKERKQPGRLPAEGGLGSSENTSKTLTSTFSSHPRLKKAFLNGLNPGTLFPRLSAY
jgi:hypothetical protein